MKLTLMEVSIGVIGITLFCGELMLKHQHAPFGYLEPSSKSDLGEISYSHYKTIEIKRLPTALFNPYDEYCGNAVDYATKKLNGRLIGSVGFKLVNNVETRIECDNQMLIITTAERRSSEEIRKNKDENIRKHQEEYQRRLNTSNQTIDIFLNK